MPEEGNQNKKWTAEQKWGLGILVFFGIAVLVFGLWQFLYRVKSPFLGRGTGWKSIEEQDLEKYLATKDQDTDGDGLSDFDEVNIYQTSAYLADSDSDGYADKQEIESGNDPNCPAGKSCGLEAGPSGETASALGGSSGLGGLVNTPGSAKAEELQALLGGQATPEAVKAALRQAGMSDEALNKIDDKTLMEIYREVLKETNASANSQNLNVNSNPNPPDLNVNSGTVAGDPSLGGLTPQEVRDLLRQEGADEAALQAVDDETLMKIWQESIK